MKIVVNAGRTVHTVEKPAVKQADGSYSRPIVKAHGPTRRIDMSDNDEAKRLIALGFAREDKPVEELEPKDPKAGDKK